MNPPNAILHELLNLAEIMLTNGAEVSRVEETLNRMGHAYGATQMNVFAITSSIVVTMVFEEGEEYTQKLSSEYHFGRIGRICPFE